MNREDQIALTVSVFTNVLHEKRERTQRGIRRRLETHDLLEKGQTNYRTQWIRESVIKVIGTLQDIAEDFNAKHPDEVCTALDFGDILMSTIKTLRSQD